VLASICKKEVSQDQYPAQQRLTTTKEQNTMANDPAEKLIDQAHAIFSKNSVHEVIDLDREMALSRLIYFYGPMLDIEQGPHDLRPPLLKKPRQCCTFNRCKLAIGSTLHYIVDMAQPRSLRSQDVR
jgi:hypothetical protein